MHGIRLRPDSTVIELKVRLFNRSDEPQTFLWWANVAAEVHSDYQSFFPSDVTTVADHAKRAVTSFPAASGPYYGVDYPTRRYLDSRPDSPIRVPGDRLDWPRNIPVPTSYMCLSLQRRLLRRVRPSRRGRIRTLGRPSLRGGEEAVDLG